MRYGNLSADKKTGLGLPQGKSVIQSWMKLAQSGIYPQQVRF